MPPVSESPPKPIAAPERSLVQRMEALQRANNIRSRRAQLKRDLKAGRQPIHELLLEPPDYLETAKVFDLLLAVPEVRAGEGQQDPVSVQDLTEQDDRRALRAPAARAGRAHASPLSRGAPHPVAGQGLRDHRALRGGEGHADPRAARAGARARAVGLGHHPQAAPGRARRRRLPLPDPRGVRAPRRRAATSSSTPTYSGNQLRDAALRARAASAPTAARWCSRSRSRAPARCARRCPRRWPCSSPRRRWRRCARGWWAAEPTAPSRSTSGCAPPRRELEAQPEFAHVVVNDRLEDATEELVEIVDRSAPHLRATSR